MVEPTYALASSEKMENKGILGFKVLGRWQWSLCQWVPATVLKCQMSYFEKKGTNVMVRAVCWSKMCWKIIMLQTKSRCVQWTHGSLLHSRQLASYVHVFGIYLEVSLRAGQPRYGTWILVRSWWQWRHKQTLQQAACPTCVDLRIEVLLTSCNEIMTLNLVVVVD